MTPQVAQRYQEQISKFEALCRGDVAETVKEKLIDAEEELDWYSLSLGFFLALGVQAEDAHALADHCRYDLRYWQEG